MTGSALAWAVKASFRAYVAGVPDGVEQREGVGLDAHGRYVFPLASAGEGVQRFSGAVRLTAYRGLLDVRIAEPWIEAGGPRARISIAHPRSDRRPELPRLVIAEIDGEGPGSPRVTFDGVRLLGDVYEVGIPLDPIEVIATAGA